MESFASITSLHMKMATIDQKHLEIYSWNILEYIGIMIGFSASKLIPTPLHLWHWPFPRRAWWPWAAFLFGQPTGSEVSHWSRVIGLAKAILSVWRNSKEIKIVKVIGFTQRPFRSPMPAHHPAWFKPARLRWFLMIARCTTSYHLTILFNTFYCHPNSRQTFSWQFENKRVLAVCCMLMTHDFEGWLLKTHRISWRAQLCWVLYPSISIKWSKPCKAKALGCTMAWCHSETTGWSSSFIMGWQCWFFAGACGCKLATWPDMTGLRRTIYILGSQQMQGLGLYLLHAPQLISDCKAITASTRITPGNYGAIFQDRSKCTICGLNLLHIP